MATLRGTIWQIRHKVAKSQLRAPFIWRHHRGLHPADWYIASYPRSGSTWLRFMLFEVLVGQDPTFITVNQAIPDVGHHHRAPEFFPNKGRLIKTHEPYRPMYSQAVYLVRDVRDVVLSEYHFQRGFNLYQRPFADFLADFLSANVNGYGSWAAHVQSWLHISRQQPQRFLLIRFEDLRQDTVNTFAKIVTFLGKPVSPQEIKRVMKNNTIQNMRRKEELAPLSIFKGERQDGHIIRSGKTNAWQSNLSQKQSAQLETVYGELLVRLGYDLDHRR